MPVWLNLILFPWGFFGILAVIGFLFIKTLIKVGNDAEAGQRFPFHKYWKSLTVYIIAFIFVIWAAQALQHYRPTSTLENPAQQQIDQREKELEQFIPPTEVPTIAPSLDIIIDENTEKRKEQNNSVKDAFKNLPDAPKATQPVDGVTPSDSITK